ncbi:MAG: glycosyltransferase [Gammaproteobacteria bacterium]
MSVGMRHWWWQRPFLYLGRMHEDKGVDVILRAWVELKDRFPDQCPPLWLAGGTPDEIERMRGLAELGDPISHYERAGSLLWWGYLDPPGLSALLCRVGVVIMHSRYEPGGRVVLEAMAQGVPVIATPHGFAAELVEDWKTGFLVDFGDRDRLLVRMAHFVCQPLLRNVLGADARIKARHALSRWDFIGSHCAVYDGLSGKTAATDDSSAASDAPRLTTFRERRVPGLYPSLDAMPSEGEVRFFVGHGTREKVIALDRVQGGRGSSIRWRVATTKRTWVVKWPYSRLARTMLWDSFTPDSLLSPCDQRFNRERLSGDLPGFVPWDAVDTDHALLLRREYPCLGPITADDVEELARCYRRLHAAPCEDAGLGSILKQDWCGVGRLEMLETGLAIREILGTGPWDPTRRCGLGMAWRQFELDLIDAPIPRAFSLPGEMIAAVRLFMPLARSELDLPLTIQHGSGDFEHCLRLDDGSLGLIDGEHIHPGLAGEDMAAAIFFALDGMDAPVTEDMWREFLEAGSETADEQLRLLSWVGYLVLDEVRAEATLARENRYKAALEKMDQVVRLTKTLISR